MWLVDSLRRLRLRSPIYILSDGAGRDLDLPSAQLEEASQDGPSHDLEVRVSGSVPVLPVITQDNPIPSLGLDLDAINRDYGDTLNNLNRYLVRNGREGFASLAHLVEQMIIDPFRMRRIEREFILHSGPSPSDMLYLAKQLVLASGEVEKAYASCGDVGLRKPVFDPRYIFNGDVYDRRSLDGGRLLRIPYWEDKSLEPAASSFTNARAPATFLSTDWEIVERLFWEIDGATGSHYGNLYEEFDNFVTDAIGDDSQGDFPTVAVSPVNSRRENHGPRKRRYADNPLLTEARTLDLSVTLLRYLHEAGIEGARIRQVNGPLSRNFWFVEYTHVSGESVLMGPSHGRMVPVDVPFESKERFMVHRWTRTYQ